LFVGAVREPPLRRFRNAFSASDAWRLYQILFAPNSEAALIGEVNGDGTVDSEDLAIVEEALRKRG
jgi:hypothetical protein